VTCKTKQLKQQPRNVIQSVQCNQIISKKLKQQTKSKGREKPWKINGKTKARPNGNQGIRERIE